MLEFSVNYRVFRGVEDPVIGRHGFGDYADRGANFKYALVTPEQSNYRFPGIAFGVDDFMGSKKFTNYFIVATQVCRDWGLEASFGWGAGTYTKGPSRGFFGGFNWFPLWGCPNKWIQGICVSAEFDPTNYKKDPHPHARSSNTPLNVGAKYTLCELVEASASYIRGEEFAVAGSVHFNWGKTEGLLPKIKDPLPYTAPVDQEPLGCVRPESVMIQQINYALEEQGFQLTHGWLETEVCGKKRLWVTVINCRYRQEHIVRMRLQHLFASLLPSNVTEVVVILESHGLLCQQYVFNREFLLKIANHCMSPFEFDILSPRKEVCCAYKGCSNVIFQRRYDLWRGRVSPRFESFFGSSSGKFKYDLGVQLDLEGFLPYNWYYELQLSQTVLSSLKDVGDFDVFHPSQLPNVATDYVNYRKSHAVTWDRLYLQRSWNFGSGWFGRVAGGYFQVNYGGVAGEVLWYPVNRCLAFGIEGAVVKKRRFTGLGFQSKLRHFKGKTPIYRPYSTLQQYFLDFYLDFPLFSIFTKVSVGQFLARDKGVRVEATRYFENGLRITGWMTYTDAHDQIHGENYYDRGIAVEAPFDFFFQCSSRRVWNYGTAAWLRDAGYATTTGRTLFDTLNRERRW